MSTFNGIGTEFIGKDEKGPDGSYIATRWFSLFLPLIPLYSARILFDDLTYARIGGGITGERYRVQRLPSLYKPQVTHQLKRTAMFGIPALIIIAIAVVLTVA